MIEASQTGDAQAGRSVSVGMKIVISVQECVRLNGPNLVAIKSTTSVDIGTLKQRTVR